MALHIPKLREGSYLACWNRGGQQALLLMQAYVEGVSASDAGLRRHLQQPGARICLDEVVESFLGRPLEVPTPTLAGRPDPEGAGGRPHRERLRGDGGLREILGMDARTAPSGWPSCGR